MTHHIGVILQRSISWLNKVHLSKFHRNRTIRAQETDDLHLKNRLFYKNRYFSPILRSKIKIPANTFTEELFCLPDTKNRIPISIAVLDISSEQNCHRLKKRTKVPSGNFNANFYRQSFASETESRPTDT